MNVQKNINLAQFTTFKIGGPAKEFVMAKDESELIEALQYAKENNLKYYIFGGGSNLYFDDRGFDGLVIKTESNDSLKLLDGQRVECWAGESLGALINFAKDNGLSGIADLAGIPGQFGGAIRGNAGAFETELKDVVINVRALDISGQNPEIKNFDKVQCEFGYRMSIFKKDHQLIVISAIIQLSQGEKEKIGERMQEVVRKRIEKQPTGWVGCAGSFFENPTVKDPKIIEKFERDIAGKSIGRKIPAGWLITEASMRGKKIGGIEVSEKHANFVLNTGGGTAEELIMMTSLIKQKVRTKSGVQLREEVQYVGY